MKGRIRELMHESPFRPFTIHLSDGRTFRIDYPDYIFAGPALGFEVLVDDGNNKLHYLSTLQIVELEFVRASETA